METTKLKNIIDAASGRRPVDLLLENAQLVNVFTSKVEQVSIAIAGGYVVGFQAHEAHRRLDLQGRFVTPGLIDAHVHLESSLTCPAEYARAVVPRGTAAVVADPHEIANVLGLDGIKYMLRASEGLPLDIYLALPSCVPATFMETAGARLEAGELAPLLEHPQVVALAEMMNFPGVIGAAGSVLAKIVAAKKVRKPVDGHAPALAGQGLQAYLAAGISSDHECTTAAEAYEKLAAGMHVMIRQGTGARNLDDLVEIVNRRTCHRIMLCTDDRHPHHLVEEGHMDALVRQAVARGVDPVTAVRLASLNPAEYFGLHHLGAVAPGRRADLVILDDLEKFKVWRVFHAGKQVAAGGRLDAGVALNTPLEAPSPMMIDVRNLDFSIPAAGRSIRVIQVQEGQIVTGSLTTEANIDQGRVVSDPGRDLLKLAVIERYSGNGGLGLGFVSGFGLKRGALASTVAHDSHNLVVVGATDGDMLQAAARLVEIGGGLVAVEKGRVLAELALPLAGLMSPEPLAKVRRCLDDLLAAASGLGCVLSDPFMSLSFLALPVIPALKLTDKGLVDVTRFELVSLFAD